MNEWTLPIGGVVDERVTQNVLRGPYLNIGLPPPPHFLSRQNPPPLPPFPHAENLKVQWVGLLSNGIVSMGLHANFIRWYQMFARDDWHKVGSQEMTSKMFPWEECLLEITIEMLAGGWLTRIFPEMTVKMSAGDDCQNVFRRWLSTLFQEMTGKINLADFRSIADLRKYNQHSKRLSLPHYL